MVRCARCVAENPVHMNFCRNCGAALAPASPATPAGEPPAGPAAHVTGPADPSTDPDAAPHEAPREALHKERPVGAARRSCPHCNAKTPAGFSFCQRCGKHLPSVSEAVRTGALISGETGGRASSSSGLTPVHSPTPPGGMRVAQVNPPVPAPAPPLPRVVPWGSLTSLNPDGSEGIRHALAGAWIAIGRSHGDLLFAEDRFLAPTHARIEHHGGRAHIVPVDTLNGVYRRLLQPTLLTHGATLLLGREMLRFELVDEDERDARPLVRHGVALFGSPAREPWARLVQLMATGGIQDVRHLWAPVVTIGREEGELVFRDDAFLSRRHAALSWRDGQCMIEDLDSANGTFLRLAGPSELHPGDVLRMGDQQLRVELGAWS